MLPGKVKVSAEVVSSNGQLALLKILTTTKLEENAKDLLVHLMLASSDGKKGDKLTTYKRGTWATGKIQSVKEDPWGRKSVKIEAKYPPVVKGTPALNDQGTLMGIFDICGTPAEYDTLIPVSSIKEFLNNKDEFSLDKPTVVEAPGFIGEGLEPFDGTKPLSQEEAAALEIVNKFTVVVRGESSELRGGMSISDMSYGAIIGTKGFIVAPDRDLMSKENNQWVYVPALKKEVAAEVIARNVQKRVVLLRLKSGNILPGLTLVRKEDYENGRFISAEYENTQRNFIDTAQICGGEASIASITGTRGLTVSSCHHRKKMYAHGVSFVNLNGDCLGVFGYYGCTTSDHLQLLIDSVSHLSGQKGDTIRGTVYEYGLNGRVGCPDALVCILDQTTSISIVTKTNGDGDFSVNFPGSERYNVRAIKEGFVSPYGSTNMLPNTSKTRKVNMGIRPYSRYSEAEKRFAIEGFALHSNKNGPTGIYGYVEDVGLENSIGDDQFGKRLQKAKVTVELIRSNKTWYDSEASIFSNKSPLPSIKTVEVETVKAGMFSVAAPPGRYKITVECKGYKTDTSIVEFKKGKYNFIGKLGKLYR